VTTSSSFTPNIGQQFGGGYFAGQIKVFEGLTEVVYNLIVSDGTNALTHDTTGVQWKNANTAETATNIFQNLVNGKTISTYALANGFNTPTYAIWQFVATANLSSPGGYNDWYLPSAAELALIYQNLKPGITSNVTVARNLQSNTSIGSGEGQWNATMGNNRSSASGTASFTVPTFTGFTSGNPAQTSVALFQTGGAQSMVAGSTNYWSSTEYSGGTGSVWNQSFNDGAQATTPKTSARLVRLVRRELAS
jgi:hypothetical protein